MLYRFLSIVFCVSALAACNGEDVDGMEESRQAETPVPTQLSTPLSTPTPVVTAPSISIEFPTKNSVVASGEQIQIRGKYNANGEKNISIIVNAGLTNVEATLDEARGTWLAENVPTDRFKTDIAIVANVVNHESGLSGQFNRNVDSLYFSNLQDVVVDSKRERLLYISAGLDAILSYDFHSKESSILFSKNYGRVEIASLDALALNEHSDVIHILDKTAGKIFNLQLETMQVEQVSLTNELQGPAIVDPNRLVVDEQNNHLYTIDRSHSIYRINMPSGKREFIAGGKPILGAQPSDLQLGLYQARDLIFDANSQKIYALCAAYGGYIWSYDLITEQHYIVSGSTADKLPSGAKLEVGSGESFVSPFRFDLDTKNNQFLVADKDNDKLAYVDLGTGNRLWVSPLTPSGIATKHAVSDLVFDKYNDGFFISDSLFDLTFLKDSVITDVDSSRVAEGPIFSHGKLQVNESTAFLVDGSSNEIFTIDLHSGERKKHVKLTPELLVYADTNLFTTGFVLDEVNNRFLLASHSPNILYSVDMSTGKHKLLAGNMTLYGISDFFPLGLSFDENASGLYFIDLYQLGLLHYSFDSDEITEISGEDLGYSEGEDMSMVSPVDFVIVENNAYVLDNILGKIIKISLTSGEREFLNPDEDQSWLYFNSITFDHISQRLIIGGGNEKSMVMVDLTSGKSTVISDNQLHRGNPIDNIIDINVDASKDRVYYSDSGASALLEMDLSTGDRFVISR